MSNRFALFNSLKYFYPIIFIITIFIGCKKETSAVIKNNNETSISIETVSTINNQSILEPTYEKYTAFVNDNAVRIRNKPSLEGTIIGQLNYGMLVSVLGRSQNRMILDENDSYWLKIKINNIEGWVYGTYLDLHETQYDTIPILLSANFSGYFTKEFLKEAITKQNLSYGDIIFDQTKISDLRIYYGGRLSYGSDTLLRYIEYGNFNIILVTKEIDSIEYMSDFLLLEKLTKETYLCNGAVQINDSYFDWKITIVVNNKWQGLFTDDISQAFKINEKTKKIEEINYDTIRLYSEL